MLTKGILPICLSDLSRTNEYGITLVSLNENFQDNYEPNAAKIHERIEALKSLHEAGCKTWVSIEPYPTPNIINQNLEEILSSIDFVDRIIFGRMHYNKDISAYKEYKSFYNSCVQKVIEFCEVHQISWHIKKGTQN